MVMLVIFTFPVTVFLKMLYAEFDPYFSKISSLGKEKTVVHSYPGKFERQSTAQYLYTIPYFLLAFPSFRFLNLFIHITSNQ